MLLDSHGVTKRKIREEGFMYTFEQIVKNGWLQTRTIVRVTYRCDGREQIHELIGVFAGCDQHSFHVCYDTAKYLVVAYDNLVTCEELPLLQVIDILNNIGHVISYLQPEQI